MKKFLMLTVFLAVMSAVIPIFVLLTDGKKYIATENINENINISVSENTENNTSAIENIEEMNVSKNENTKENSVLLHKKTAETLPKMYIAKDFLILNISTGKVEKVDVFDYVVGAVAAEMPPTFNEEALKAQAVASHTLALRNRINHMKTPIEELKGADFKADPDKRQGYVTKDEAKKMYGEYFDKYWSKIEKACKEVLNQVITYENAPIEAAYHSMSAGFTENSVNVWSVEKPYLMPVESSGDKLSPKYKCEVNIAKDDLIKLLKENYSGIILDKNPLLWFNILSSSKGGYITLIDVGNITISGTDMRKLLSLRSHAFEISFDDDVFTFTTFGYGHGVGLSQYGAEFMANGGKNYKEILSHYYKGATLSEY